MFTHAGISGQVAVALPCSCSVVLKEATAAESVPRTTSAGNSGWLLSAGANFKCTRSLALVGPAFRSVFTAWR